MSGPVMVGFVHGGWIRAEFLNAVLNAVSGPDSDPAIGGVISSSAGPLLALGRNNLVAQFLDSDFDWLCSIDTDIVFATDTVSRLLESADPVETPIMSAVYHVFDNGVKVQSVYMNMSGGTELDVKNVEITSEDSVVEVFAVGAGCLLVHRSVFEKIKKGTNDEPCWFREVVIDGRDFGEDISFCLRANVAGFPICVNTGVQVGHIKSAMLGSVK